jgi:hypothetical protein
MRPGFSTTFVLSEGKSSNSWIEVNVFFRLLSSYISNTHFVCTIDSLAINSLQSPFGAGGYNLAILRFAFLNFRRPTDYDHEIVFCLSPYSAVLSGAHSLHILTLYVLEFMLYVVCPLTRRTHLNMLDDTKSSLVIPVSDSTDGAISGIDSRYMNRAVLYAVLVRMCSRRKVPLKVRSQS